MAANKFATMLHRNTNKITVVLVYAFLEWTLIALLLFNSLFSYLIVKFADYFGLKRPCVWCSRLDHVFEPRNRRDSHRDLICEAHAREISSLEYCSSHKRLADSRDMCDDCSSLSSSESNDDCWPSKNFDFFPWVSKIGIVDEFDNNGVLGEEKVKLCSCCGVSLSNSKRFYHPCIVIKPSSWGVLDYAQKKGLVEDNHDDHNDDDDYDQTDHSDRSRSDFVSEPRIEENSEETVETEENDDEMNCCEKVAEESEIGVRHLDFYIGEEDCTLIPIDNDCKGTSFGTEEEGEDDVILDLDMDAKTRRAETVAENWHSSGETFEFETVVFKPILVSQGTQTVQDNEEARSDDVVIVHQEGCDNDDDDGEISIGTEIPDHEQVETSIPCDHEEEEEHFTSSINLHFHHNHALDFEQANEEEEEPLSPATEMCGGLEPEKLKWALRAVYAELEEERSASAVAASHTMAMINRLQEEKAAVQMEAVHYRRLMEEQSVHDHEALRLLHIENSDLRNHLDLYRIKIDGHDHDRDRDRNHDDDDDDYQSTPIEAVLHFEEERLTILDQLRVLEEKLFELSDEDAADEYRNSGTRVVGLKGRRLLPLFDESGGCGDDVAPEEEECGGCDDDVAPEREVVDRVYGRLQALEADREFVRRCVSSLQKGDKGLRLLREVLDHLRRLRTVDPDRVF